VHRQLAAGAEVVELSAVHGLGGGGAGGTAWRALTVMTDRIRE
jgi:hypothetical protein